MGVKMARPRKPARLYLHPKERVWLIRDGEQFIRTGCIESSLGEAETALNQYLVGKFTARKRVSDLAALPIAEVLNAYATEHAINLKSAAAIGNDLMPLIDFFGELALAEVNKNLCNAYMAFRRKQGIKLGNRTVNTSRSVSNGTLRRELAILSAAIGYWHANHGPITAVPTVSLPEISPGRDKHLEQDERVRLLAGALGFYQSKSSDISTRRERVRWVRLRQHINYHLVRFILLGLATGSRKGVILGARWMANTHAGWVDLDKAVFYPRALDEIETKKRKPPSALGRHIMAHLCRWKRIDDAKRERHVAAGGSVLDYQTIINFHGKEIADIKNSWAVACDLAYLPSGNHGFVRHTLRHTRATMLMRDRDVPIWEAAGQLGMSPKLMQDRYGHHSPRFQEAAKNVR